MTRVFVYEYTCAAPAASVDAAGASALNAEGAAMLAALLEDFGRIPGVEPFTIRAEPDEQHAFRAAVARADWCLIIAPEFDDILLMRCRWAHEEQHDSSALSPRLCGGRGVGVRGDSVFPRIEQSPMAGERGCVSAPRKGLADDVISLSVTCPSLGALTQPRSPPIGEGRALSNTECNKLIGCSSTAIELCSDKLALFHHWQSRGVPTPETLAGSVEPLWPEWVLKPRFGAGSQDTHLNGEPRERGAVGPMIVQEFIPGRAASVAFLCGPNELIALPPAEQLLSDDGHFHYRGGRLPLSPDLASRAEAIARQALESVSGLCGYVGVDLVLGDDGRDWAIEINPRLTTLYLGLRKLAKSNLAAAMLQIASGERTPRLEWYAGPVEFHV